MAFGKKSHVVLHSAGTHTPGSRELITPPRCPCRARGGSTSQAPRNPEQGALPAGTQSHVREDESARSWRNTGVGLAEIPTVTSRPRDGISFSLLHILFRFPNVYTVIITFISPFFPPKSHPLLYPAPFLYRAVRPRRFKNRHRQPC